MLDPLSGLTRWERWALETWLDSMEGRGPAEIKWSELPPVRYARALGQLAFDRGMKLPRRYVRDTSVNRLKGSLATPRSIRATRDQ